MEEKGFEIRPYNSGSTLYLKIPTQLAEYLKINADSTFWLVINDDKLIYEIQKR